MKAARLYGIGDIRIEDIPPPGRVTGDEVLLKVLAAGICGSDVHNYRTGQWFSRLPVTPGHEFCAEVIAVGDAVRHFRPGDRVAADSRANCGQCDMCTSGHGNLCRSMGFVGEVCDGGFAEFAVLEERRLLALPADLAPELAVLSEPIGVALRVIHQLQAPSGAVVAVAGGGTIGGLVAFLLHEVFHHRVILFEKSDARRQLLARATTFESCPLDAVVLGQLNQGEDICYWVEATGSAAVLEQLIQRAGPASRIALVGLFGKEVSLDVNRLVEAEIQLVGCSVFCDEQQEAIRLLPCIAEKLRPLVGAPVALDALPEMFRLLCAGQVDALKTVIKPGV